MNSSDDSLKTIFTLKLLEWHRDSNHRCMPWKGDKDPYRIWISEIILQQTRVEQGLPYFQRFIKAYPTVKDLASAPDNEVLKKWEGLGYYSRCRNLLITARYVAQDLNGVFPTSYEDICKLKGIGPYTAAAISSFAYNLPYAVVDGNVYRVLSRYFGIGLPVDTSGGKTYFSSLADELIDRDHPSEFNQAIMDFGATVCKPQPLCTTCIYLNHCQAYKQERVNDFPVKTKKAKIRKRWFYYVVLKHKNFIAVRQRTQNDIWQGLFEFPLIESDNELSTDEVIKKAQTSGWAKDRQQLISLSEEFKQKLSHQEIRGNFLTFEVLSPLSLPEGFSWIDEKGLAQLPFPKYVNYFLKIQLNSKIKSR